MPYEYEDRVPTPEEHRRLADSVGWSHAFDWDAMPASLAGSVCGVVASSDGEVVGMGRVVGDGAYYFYVQDVAVTPGHQGAGVGTEIVRRLVAAVDSTAPAKAFVGVFATALSGTLYQQHGFAVHPGMTGMFRVVPG